MEELKRLEDEAVFREQLRQDHWTVVNVSPDGNCLFHATLKGLPSDSPFLTVQELREGAASVLESSPEQYSVILLEWYEERVKQTRSKSQLSPTEILKKAVSLRAALIRKDGEWGDDLEISLMSKLLQRNFWVHQKDRVIIKIEGHAQWPVIHLSYHNQNHYNFLTKYVPPPPPPKRGKNNSQRNDVDANFITELRSKGWEVIPIDRAGNGFYQSVRHSLGENCEFESSKHLREEIADYLQRNPGDFKASILHEVIESKINQLRAETGTDFIDTYEPNKEQDEAFFREGLRNRVAWIREGKDWSEEVEIKLTCKFLDKTIVVHEPNHIDKVYGREFFDSSLECEDLEDAIHLSLHSSMFYKPLRKIGASTKDPLSSPGMIFLAKQVFARGRQSVDHLILIPKTQRFNKRTLKSSLNALRIHNKSVLHTFTYYSEMRRELQNDETVQRLFVIYCQRIDISVYTHLHRRYRWLNRALVTHAITTALKVRWNGVEFEYIFVNGPRSLVESLIDHFWTQSGRMICKDIKEILSKPEILFCYGCTSKCLYHGMDWHIDLSKSTRLDYCDEDKIGDFQILTRWRVFGAVRKPILPVFQGLQDIYNNLTNPVESVAQQNSLQEVAAILKANADLSETFHTYLVLVLNGAEMENTDADFTIEDLLSSNEVFKMLYAGRSARVPFRDSHWHCAQDTSLGEVVSRNSRLYMLRSIQFPSKEEAMQDEAYVIELLKLTVRFRFNKNGKLPFILLNIQSEVSNLTQLTSTQQEEITAFACGDYPVFIAPDDDQKLADIESFPGCYVVETLIEVPLNTRHGQRGFAHVKNSIIQKKTENELGRGEGKAPFIN